MQMEFFCFECGVTFDVVHPESPDAVSREDSGCSCDLIDNLYHMAIRPAKDERGLDLGLFYPPNYILVTDNGETGYTMFDGEERFYSLS